jgi:hypothetical protein
MADISFLTVALSNLEAHPLATIVASLGPEQFERHQ